MSVALGGCIDSASRLLQPSIGSLNEGQDKRMLVVCVMWRTLIGAPAQWRPSCSYAARHR